MTKPNIKRDLDGKKITVERMFNAPRTRVWEAWTTAGLLEKWWAPKPWKAVTESFDFREGGHWHYHMTGTKGEKEWCWVEYKKIMPQEEIANMDAFCDAEGTIRPDMPQMDWNVRFEDAGGGTKIITTVFFATPEDMTKTIEMGFEEGYSMGLQNLEELLLS